MSELYFAIDSLPLREFRYSILSGPESLQPDPLVIQVERVGEDGMIEFCFASGDFVNSGRHDLLRETLWRHTDYSDMQDTEALRATGARFGPWSRAEFLAQALPRLKALGKHFEDRLSAAIKAHDTAQVERLVRLDPNGLRKAAYPWLVFAAMHGHPPVMTALLNAGANPNLADAPTGDTPLARAVQNDSLEMTELLLNAKADPNQRTGAGQCCTVLHVAVLHAREGIVRALVAHPLAARNGERDANTTPRRNTHDNRGSLRSGGCQHDPISEYAIIGAT